jgi:scyllo-inositol 2-dehydrogenase (NADP+)
MSPVRTALIGYGLAGAVFHAPFIEAVDGLDLSAIVTANPERRAKAEREHPRARVLDTAAAVWDAATDFELVVVAAPNRAHAELTRTAIDKDLAVVVDKPLTPIADEARQLVRDARARGVFLSVFQNRRWDGDFLTARRLIAEGALGNVVRFESRFDRWRPQPAGGWRESGEPEEGGGLLLDLGSHLVDQALQLFGPAWLVYAELDRRREGAEVDDDAFIAVTHESGVHSHLWMTTFAAQPGPRFRVLGDRAAYGKHGVDVQEEQLRSGMRPSDAGFGEEPEEQRGMLGVGPDARPVPTERGDYARFYEGVVEALGGNASPPVDPDDAVTALEVLDAARISAAEARTVEL